jgi:hypothetical protein
MTASPEKELVRIFATMDATTACMQVVELELDALSELGEMESLRLQMAMDRLSKFIATLSNLLKKVADTEQALVGNIK